MEDGSRPIVLVKEVPIITFDGGLFILYPAGQWETQRRAYTPHTFLQMHYRAAEAIREMRRSLGCNIERLG